MDDKEKDVNEEEQPSTPQEGEDVENTEEPSSSEPSGDDVENTEEGSEVDEMLDETLSDGTSKKKNVSLKYDKFQDINEKSKLYESFAPLLAKLNENPELLEQVKGEQKADNTEGKEDVETLAERVKRIEDDGREQKRSTMRATITKALSTWGDDFRNNWEQVKPLAEQLERQGLSYDEAVQRSYFAVHPEAAQQEQRLVEQRNATQYENERGTMQTTRGSATASVHNEPDYSLSDGEKQVARELGIDSKLFKKHQEHIAHLKDL